MADRGNEVEKLKRQAGDLVAELQARNLLIPAGFLVVMILAAMFVLPKSPTPPPPINSVPIADTAMRAEDFKQVASLTVVSAVPLDRSPETYGNANPFKVGTSTSCKLTKASKPRQFSCVIGETVVTYSCLPSDTFELCVKGASGSGATGSAGSGATETTGGSTPPSDGNTNPGGDTTPKSDTKTTTTYYTIDVSYDGKTVKGLEAGDQLPTSGTAVVFYAGPNASAKKVGFVLGDNVSVQGAKTDPELGTFEVAKSDEVVLTAADGTVHTLVVKKITKVTKAST